MGCGTLISFVIYLVCNYSIYIPLNYGTEDLNIMWGVCAVYTFEL